jgi:hypothetical protein
MVPVKNEVDLTTWGAIASTAAAGGSSFSI